MIHASFVKQLRVQRSSDWLIFVGFALLGITVFYTALIFAIDTGGVSLAFILLYSAPVFVALFAWLLLKERMSRYKLLLVGLAILGVLLVSQDSGSGINVSGTSLFWGLLSGFSYASYYIFGKFLLDRYQTVTIYALIMPIGALSLLPLVTFSPKTSGIWLSLILLAFISTYLAYLLYYLGLKHVEASRAVLIATVEPVAAAGLAALFYNERLGIAGLLGALCILAAALLSAVPGKRPLDQAQ